MKKKAPELGFSPQANMLHLLKSAKSIALPSPKRNTVVVQPSIIDMMSGKGTQYTQRVTWKCPYFLKTSLFYHFKWHWLDVVSGCWNH